MDEHARSVLETALKDAKNSAARLRFVQGVSLLPSEETLLLARAHTALEQAVQKLSELHDAL